MTEDNDPYEIKKHIIQETGGYVYRIYLYDVHVYTLGNSGLQVIPLTKKQKSKIRGGIDRAKIAEDAWIATPFLPWLNKICMPGPIEGKVFEEKE